MDRDRVRDRTARFGGWLVTARVVALGVHHQRPFAVLTALLVAYAVPGRATTKQRARVDLVGGVLCALGLGGPVFALIERPAARGGANPLMSATLVGGIAVSRRSLALAAPDAGRRCCRWGSSGCGTSRCELETLSCTRASRRSRSPGAVPTAARRLHALNSGLALIPITLVLSSSRRASAGCRSATGRARSWPRPLIAATPLFALAWLKPGFAYCGSCCRRCSSSSVGLARSTRV